MGLQWISARNVDFSATQCAEGQLNCVAIFSWDELCRVWELALDVLYVYSRQVMDMDALLELWFSG